MKLDQSFVNMSLSHATLLEDDLIEAFEGFLGEHDPTFEPENVSDEEKPYYLNEDLFNRLNSIAPDGTYFGSHPGDGSDFGFWEFDENDF